MSSDTSTLSVDLGRRSYDIVIGAGVIKKAGALIKPHLANNRVIVITDKNVANHWLGPLEATLDAAGVDHQNIVLEPGEQTKKFSHVEKLSGQLLDAQVERSTVLIALGGGVIGDLTGFVAAITLRGLDFIQIPTTLLAQVDSSVGGKTGINTAQGKNLIGAFHQPLLVAADIATLATLPARQKLAGYAEVVKYGLIGDADFFAWLESNAKAVIEGDADATRYAILESCRAKAAIVAEDEKEHGQRALLNLGHTFGHALEAQVGYGDNLLHGEAVAIGTMMAFDLSVRMRLCPEADRDRVLEHFKDIGLPVGLERLADKDWSSDGLISLMGQDKKVQSGEMTFILMRTISQAFITRDVPEDDLAAVLDGYLSI
ncbi:MAG: 3-dehydroquinate synthase [Rhodospirillales bacterium]